jgi:hypothetical protein
MPVHSNQPTSYPEANALLQEFLGSVKNILRSHFIGLYLDGSLAIGDFDQESDLDFVVVTNHEVSGDIFSALQAMHEHFTRLDSWCASQLEGSYISQHAFRRYDPAHAVHPYLQRGKGERLKVIHHNTDWVIHRYVLREYGITMAGPDPRTLIDPVLPNDLRRAVLEFITNHGEPVLSNPIALQSRGYQSLWVLSLCRMHYTLQHGSVVSKSIAARWAQTALEKRWIPLIERALIGRQNPDLKASFTDANETLAFIRTTLDFGQRFQIVEESAVN